MTSFAKPVCGFTWGWVGSRADWDSPEAEESFEALLTTGINWVTIAFQALQETAQSTEIDFQNPELVSDQQVRTAIRRAKSRGVKVCLKPVVNCSNGTWRGFISFFDQDVPGEPSWGEWFASYRKYILHFAKIAEQEGCELFCVGCEMVMADSRDAEWRETIRLVREIYSGPITYNCDKYQEDRLTWWDAVDVISSSGYYPEGSWPQHLSRIGDVVRRENKPFLFLEAGCPSRDTSPARPNDWTLRGNPDGDAQLRYYRELFSSWGEDWFGGVMLWDWPARLYSPDSAASNTDYCVYAKPAEQFLRDEFSRLQEARK